MTDRQMYLLKEIYNSMGEQIHLMEWATKQVNEIDIKYLIQAGYVIESIGEGFVGGLRTLKLTDKGKDIAKNYCDVCGCMPCDCGYGS